ncbi:choice-of-anchor E domain-containing protein [Rubellicoccus peritrichatus]|uniref:Choice-of-anchor E domain-containing protein n=1 Tax=Rubellicoccus peritrichatus TaxID=3080537 RepID=A0AAQ3LE18_9BACT|nr:choice-of-anchor E domain-containing protein [Puniceicoccus sp. CR14]WOO41863.1 choice-of-anchor E domain-containing protein [Puniceicoccus sp. CR14]
MKSVAFIVLTLILTQHLRAVLQMQTITLNTAEVIASGTSSGNSDETVEVTFPDFDFVFDQFDPALGTLDQVTFDYALSYSSEVTTSSLTSADPGFDTDSDIHYRVNPSINGTFILGTGGGNGQVSTTPDEVVDVNVGVSQSSVVSTGQLETMGLEGTGTVVFDVGVSKTFGIPNFSVSGYFTDYSVERDAGATLTVTYDYTPVPEPSIYAAGLAFVALGFAWFRRKRS